MIIPAHNEAKNLSRLLPLLENDHTLEIIVVCNACTDGSEEICSLFPNVKLLSTTVPSKINALNSGDCNAKYFPRFYMDADIIISSEDIHKTALKMTKCNALACAPKLTVDFNKRPFLIKNYYKVWLSTPYCKKGMIGSGIYGISEEGRKRFKNFPQIISDDGFIRLLFNKSERVIDHNSTFIIQAPWNLKNLFKIKIRSHLGNFELNDKYPELRNNENTNNKRFLLKELIRPWKTLNILIYIFLKFIIKKIAKRKFNNNDIYGWARDTTNR